MGRFSSWSNAVEFSLAAVILIVLRRQQKDRGRRVLRSRLLFLLSSRLGLTLGLLFWIRIFHESLVVDSFVRVVFRFVLLPFFPPVIASLNVESSGLPNRLQLRPRGTSSSLTQQRVLLYQVPRIGLSTESAALLESFRHRIIDKLNGSLLIIY